MSPTSYQTAPPRELIITIAVIDVKLVPCTAGNSTVSSRASWGAYIRTNARSESLSFRFSSAFFEACTCEGQDRFGHPPSCA
jgi:hypothetical protein